MAEINCNNFKSFNKIVKDIKDDIIELRRKINNELKNINIESNLNLNGSIIPKKNNKYNLGSKKKKI